MLNIVLGNLFSLFAFCLIFYEAASKDKKKILKLQIIDALLFVISNIFLNAISGSVINFISSIRSYFGYKGNLKTFGKTNIVLLTIVAGVIFRDKEWYGILPVIASSSYATVVLFSQNIKIIKVAFIFNSLLWIVYSFMTLNFVNGTFSIFIVIINAISLIQIIRDEYNTEKCIEDNN